MSYSNCNRFGGVFKVYQESWCYPAAGALLRRFFYLEAFAMAESCYRKRGYRKPRAAPNQAMKIPPDPICTKYERCKGCPYPMHGFVCWGSEEGDCLRTRMRRCSEKKLSDKAQQNKFE